MYSLKATNKHMQEGSKGGTVAVSPGSSDAEGLMRKVLPYSSSSLLLSSLELSDTTINEP